MLGIMEPPLHVLLKAAEEQHDIGLALYIDGGDASVGVEAKLQRCPCGDLTGSGRDLAWFSGV